jgi:hypothetical protein
LQSYHPLVYLGVGGTVLDIANGENPFSQATIPEGLRHAIRVSLLHQAHINLHAAEQLLAEESPAF